MNEPTTENLKRNFHLKLLFFHISYFLFFLCSFCYSYQRTFCYSIYHLFFIRRLYRLYVWGQKKFTFYVFFWQSRQMLLLRICLDNAITESHVTRFTGSERLYNLWNVLINILEWHLATINSTFFLSGSEVYFICLFIKMKWQWWWKTILRVPETLNSANSVLCLHKTFTSLFRSQVPNPNNNLHSKQIWHI